MIETGQPIQPKSTRSAIIAWAWDSKLFGCLSDEEASAAVVVPLGGLKELIFIRNEPLCIIEAIPHKKKVYYSAQVVFEEWEQFPK